MSLPRVGEIEDPEAFSRRGVHSSGGGRRFKHNKVTPAKPLDKRRTDYEKKVSRFKKKDAEAGDASTGPANLANGKKKGRYGGKPIGRVKTELKSNEQIRKSRKIMERKRAKNARPRHAKKGR